MGPSRYESRGVSSDKKEVHLAIQKLDQGLFANTFCKILADPFSDDTERCMILHADTAGTKTILAYLYWLETGNIEIWKGIAQDALVMNVDDMACSGAVDKFVISNTILRNKKLISGQVLEKIIEGTVEFMESMKPYGIDMVHAGGETADVGDVVRTADVGFTALSYLTRRQVFQNNIQPGDLILGIGSYGQAVYEKEYNSGIGCNGLTSARHDVLHHHYATKYPETFDPAIDRGLVYSGTHFLTENFQADNKSIELGKLLLSPTRTFLPLLREIFTQSIDGLHGLIHCTGGAHSKVLKFCSGVNIIKDNLPAPPLIFDLIQKSSQSSDEEMYKVLNMGIRLELYGTEKILTTIQTRAQELKLPCQFIGRVESNKQQAPTVKMKVAGKEWIYQ